MTDFTFYLCHNQKMVYIYTPSAGRTGILRVILHVAERGQCYTTLKESASLSGLIEAYKR